MRIQREVPAITSNQFVRPSSTPCPQCPVLTISADLKSTFSKLFEIQSSYAVFGFKFKLYLH